MSLDGAAAPLASPSTMAPSGIVAGRRRKAIASCTYVRERAEKPEASMGRKMGKEPINAHVRLAVR